MIRPIFRKLSRKIRHQLLEGVLLSVPKKIRGKATGARKVLLNLIRDQVTPDAIMQEIIQYLLDNGYPSKRDERVKLRVNNPHWRRQGGHIGVKVGLVSTIQKSTSLSAAFQIKLEGLSEETHGASFSNHLEIEDLSDVQDAQARNNERYSNTGELNFRESKDDQNFWFTWNLIDTSKPNINISSKQTLERIFRILGMGHSLNLKKQTEFIVLFFRIEKDTNLLFKPAWGDANTYHYWKAVDDKKKLYGETEPILSKKYANLKPQPEAVGVKKNFTIEQFESEYSFSFFYP